ncbi:MAG TPA: N-acetyltransferase [Firmicutes bacterium]|jgi:GNAT superfamily N-acetyltransferase|nr:N-acetyltransferase [Bacillota bacterium]
MDNISIKPVLTRSDMREFLLLPRSIYKNDPNWVPPLLHELKKKLDPRFNSLLSRGPYRLFLSRDSVGRPLSRLLVGVDELLNQAKGRNEGYIALFEAGNEKAGVLLLNHACEWLLSLNKGINQIKGPISPTKGDDLRGLLIWGFNSPPVMMNSYNPPEYATYFEKAGFIKDLDLYAYYYDLKTIDAKKTERVVSYAQRKYGFQVKTLNLSQLDTELKDIKYIIDRAMPEDWEDLVPPNLEELKVIADQLKDFAIPELIPIARSLKGKPIGFAISLPDYNKVLPKLNGRLFPIGWAKFLLNRHRVSGARVFVLFVIPEFRKKGVSGTIFYQLLLKAKALGFTYGEGSTIGELNTPMRRDAEGAGGLHYKTYRVYKKSI